MVEGAAQSRITVSAVMVLLSTFVPVYASGADDLIGQGLTLRQGGHDQDALPFFLRALAEDPTPRALGQLGFCEQALGLWISAEAHLDAALKHPEDNWVHDREVVLSASLAAVRVRLGLIEVWGGPAGAKVSIDGEVVATLPMSHPARAVQGPREVTIEAVGFAPQTATIQVHAGETAREHVALRAVSVPLTPPNVPDLRVVPPNPQMAARVISADSPADAPPNGTKIFVKWWFWAAVGVAAAATGTVYLVAHRSIERCAAPKGGVCTDF